MLIGNIEFSDKCPENCSLKEDMGLYGQNSICGRCPIFVCSGFEPLVEPEDYREDWAKVWKEWFENGMKSYPKLKL